MLPLTVPKFFPKVPGCAHFPCGIHIPRNLDNMVTVSKLPYLLFRVPPKKKVLEVGDESTVGTNGAMLKCIPKRTHFLWGMIVNSRNKLGNAQIASETDTLTLGDYSQCRNKWAMLKLSPKQTHFLSTFLAAMGKGPSSGMRHPQLVIK